MASANIITIAHHFGRPAVFLVVIILHAIILLTVHFALPDVQKDDEKQYEVLKLVDVQEYVPPPPPHAPAPAPSPEVKIQQVVNQAKAAEQIVETEDVVQEIVEAEPVYLPQHKISAIPEIPTKTILANIEYPPMALKQGLQGVVYLELYIDDNGRIRKIVVLKDPGHGFADAAVAALTGITCKPALANGIPVAVRFRYPVRFSLN